MDHRFSKDELLRLLGVAIDVAERHGCTPGEAVAHLERAAVAAGDATGRSIGDFAGDLRRLRARRNDLLGAEVVRDPAWDILLDLVAAREEGRETCVKTLCAGSGVPATTAMRHIERLERHGLVRRRPHELDSRRAIISLAPDQAERVERLVAMFRDLH